MRQVNGNRQVTPASADVFEFRRPSWQSHALCRGRTSEFFAEHMTRGQLAELKLLCAQCTVRHECLEMALNFETDRDGVFGGCTVSERARIRASRISNVNGHSA